MAIPSYRGFSLEEYPIKEIEDLCIAIVRTEWNSAIVDKMELSCADILERSGVKSDNIHQFVVPGSYELPLGAKYVLSSTLKPDAIICLGCVIQGETKHDDYINHTIARNISQLSLISGTPVIFGVLTTNTLLQAEERAGGAHGNKGEECALTALKMISLKEKLSSQTKKIRF
jgi:6,7-dimethyl-8-ribityllumazine synthase